RVAGVGRLAGLEVTGRPGADPAAARREAGGRQVGAGLAPRGVPRLDQDPRPSHARTEPTTTPRMPAPTPPRRAEVTATARMPRDRPGAPRLRGGTGRRGPEGMAAHQQRPRGRGSGPAAPTPSPAPMHDRTRRSPAAPCTTEPVDPRG